MTLPHIKKERGPMKTELLRLAELCEQAGGPDHVLDAEIVCAINGYTMHEDSDPLWGVFAFWDRGICHNCSRWPEFTASIDEALALAKGIGVLITLSEIKGDGMPMCVIGNPGTSELFEAVANTMPLAVCAAALRARASMENPQ